MRILVMGLPTSGKSYFSEQLSNEINFQWLNADKIRHEYNDWDFSYNGRIRQAQRMTLLSLDKNVICDFVCPLEEMRQIINADIIIWMNTIEFSPYDDTNKLFERPDKVDFEITNWNQSNEIIEKIKNLIVK